MGASFGKRLCMVLLMLSLIFIPAASAERMEVGKAIDAVVEWDNGKAYFFKGGQYVRYDIKADRVDPGYPKPINRETWPGLPWTEGIDAAVNGATAAYFSRGRMSVRHQADRVSGYPKPSKRNVAGGGRTPGSRPPELGQRQAYWVKGTRRSAIHQAAG